MEETYLSAVSVRPPTLHSQLCLFHQLIGDGGCLSRRKGETWTAAWGLELSIEAATFSARTIFNRVRGASSRSSFDREWREVHIHHSSAIPDLVRCVKTLLNEWTELAHSATWTPHERHPRWRYGTRQDDSNYLHHRLSQVVQENQRQVPHHCSSRHHQQLEEWVLKVVALLSSCSPLRDRGKWDKPARTHARTHLTCTLFSLRKRGIRQSKNTSRQTSTMSLLLPTKAWRSVNLSSKSNNQAAQQPALTPLMLLIRIEWEYMIVDEAHKLKNETSQLS